MSESNSQTAPFRAFDIERAKEWLRDAALAARRQVEKAARRILPDAQADRLFGKELPSFALPVPGNRKMSIQYMKRGVEHYNEHRYEKADRYFKRAVTADESHAQAHYYRGLALYKLNQVDAALAEWLRASQVEPDSEAADKARRKLEGIGPKYEKAIEAFRKQMREP